MTIHERLRMLDARKIISVKEISEAMNIQERTVSNWFSGSVRNLPHSLFAYLVEQKPSINLAWLLTGSGDMLNDGNNNYSIKTPPIMKVEERTSDPPPQDETIKKLATVIETLTMQINELPALREKINLLEKEVEFLKRR